MLIILGGLAIKALNLSSPNIVTSCRDNYLDTNMTANSSALSSGELTTALGGEITDIRPSTLIEAPCLGQAFTAGEKDYVLCESGSIYLNEKICSGPLGGFKRSADDTKQGLKMLQGFPSKTQDLNSSSQ